jgi:hypothetical protein
MALPRCWPVRLVASWPITIDDPGRDAGVLQPGREGVPKVVSAMQIHGLQQRVEGRGQRTPTLLTIPVHVSHQLGGHKFTQGDLDRGWPNRPAVLGECGGELVGSLRAASSERLEDAGGGRPQLARGVGQLGQRGLVGAVEVVARQHSPDALWHPGPTGPSGAAARAGEDQGRRVAAVGQLAVDGLDH